MTRIIQEVFVPFLGDFLSILCATLFKSQSLVFVPFLGDFLSILMYKEHLAYNACSFRPLSWGLSFNSVPAKPQPICSRKRICGGDGGIASSGTLLRR